MKRTQHIDLSRMRKGNEDYPVRAFGVIAATTFLSGCGGDDAQIYRDEWECMAENPELVEQCQTAYSEAVEEAQRSAPKYDDRQSCEYEFGYGSCSRYRYQDDNWYIPDMAGFMLAHMVSSNHYASAPLFVSTSHRHSYRDRWLGVDGYDYGHYKRKTTKFNKKTFERKKSIYRTVSRGGFGKTVKAQARLASRSSGRSWGG